MTDDNVEIPDLGCATATPLELKLLASVKAYARGDDGAVAEYVATLVDFLKGSGQMTDDAILKPLTDMTIGKK